MGVIYRDRLCFFTLVYLRFWPDDDERLSDFNVWFYE